MKKKTKIILLLAISLVTLSIGINKKYLTVYGSFTSTNKNGQLVERGYHLDKWIEVLEDMEKLQTVHSNAFGDDFLSGLDEMKRINMLCYFLFFVSGVALIIMIFTMLPGETIEASQELDKKPEG